MEFYEPKIDFQCSSIFLVDSCFFSESQNESARVVSQPLDGG